MLQPEQTDLSEISSYPRRVTKGYKTKGTCSVICQQVEDTGQIWTISQHLNINIIVNTFFICSATAITMSFFQICIFARRYIYDFTCYVSKTSLPDLLIFSVHPSWTWLVLCNPLSASNVLLSVYCQASKNCNTKITK